MARFVVLSSLDDDELVRLSRRLTSLGSVYVREAADGMIDIDIDPGAENEVRDLVTREGATLNASVAPVRIDPIPAFEAIRRARSRG